MDRRLKLQFVAAAGIAAVAAACAWSLATPAAPSAPRATRASLAAVAAPKVAGSPPALVEHCRRAAELLYDVHWAAACFQINDGNDCMLPDAQAAKVNAILESEESRCLAAEMQASIR